MCRAPNRREFLAAAAAAFPVAHLVVGTATRPQDSKPAAKELPFKISLAEWSFHRHLFGEVKPKLDNLEFPKVAHDLGIDVVEYVNQFFKDKADDEKYLGELKKRCDGVGVRSGLIMIDGEGALGAADSKERDKAVTNHHRWVRAARFLGCHTIRVNAQSSGTPEEQMKLAAEGLAKLCEYGETMGINVIVENHGGLSSNAAWLASVMRAVSHPRLGTLPDFGNFRISDKEQYDRYLGTAEMMPFAKGVSAKSYDFDDKGNETTIDYARMMKIVVDGGYHGHVGIEYEGNRLDEYAGVRATKTLLERVRATL